MPTLTLVDQQYGMPLAVVRGGVPKKGDTVWVGEVPYCVVGRDRDTLVVKLGGWKGPNGKPGRTLYARNPINPVSFSGYQGGWNPDLPEGLPKFVRGPGIQPDPGTGVPFGGFPTAKPMAPHYSMAPPWVQEQIQYQPKVWTVYHFQWLVPVFRLEGMYPPKVGETETVEGRKYQYTEIRDDGVLVRPIPSWDGALVTEDKSTGDAIAWRPLTNMNKEYISMEKHRMKILMKKKFGIERHSYHMYVKTWRQLRRYFTNPSRRSGKPRMVSF